MAQPESQLAFQNLLGQTLLNPPNVAGWPSGTSWIDTSTMMLRLKLPQILSGIRPLEDTPKENDDLNMGSNADKLQKQFFKNQMVTVDWAEVLKNIGTLDLPKILLQKERSLPKAAVESFGKKDCKSEIIALMSTPEYQLC